MDAALPRSVGFQWNAGGWFGGQLGGTLWMLLAAAFLVPVDPVVAALTFAVFLVPTALGFFLWNRRGRYRPYPCLQLFIGVTGLCALTLFVLWRGMAGEHLSMAFGGQSAYVHYAWLLVFPGLMLLFHFQERSARRAQRRETGPVS